MYIFKTVYFGHDTVEGTSTTHDSKTESADLACMFGTDGRIVPVGSLQNECKL